MANNTTLNAGSGGDSIQNLDMSNFAGFGYPTTTGKLPCTALYVSQAIGTIPTPVTALNTLPVTIVGAIPAGASSIGTVVLGAGSAAVGKVSTNADCTLAAGTAPADAFAIAGVYNTTNPAAAAGQTVGIQTDPSGVVRFTASGLMPMYSASASFAPAASATDVAVLPASATKTVKVVRVKVQLNTTGTANTITVQLVKRTALDTGGTSSGMTVLPHNPANANGTAAPVTYTVNPAGLGASAGAADTNLLLVGTATTLSNEYVYDCNTPGWQPITLAANTNQNLAVNLGGGTVAATALAKVTFTYTEE